MLYLVIVKGLLLSLSDEFMLLVAVTGVILSTLSFSPGCAPLNELVYLTVPQMGRCRNTVPSHHLDKAKMPLNWKAEVAEY